MKTFAVLMLLGLPLLSGCVTKHRVKLDPMIPHQISQPATVWVWSLLPDGRAVEVEVELTPNWWLASPLLVEPIPGSP